MLLADTADPPRGANLLVRRYFANPPDAHRPPGAAITMAETSDIAQLSVDNDLVALRHAEPAQLPGRGP